MDEKKIMDLITSEYSWEQVIYKIIAWEGLDPWNLNLQILSTSFVNYLLKMKELDFKVPAKYLIITAVLLRMKSDHLQYIGDVVSEYMNEDEETGEEDGTAIEDDLNGLGEQEKFEVTPVTVPPKRHPRRKIMITELITALRAVLKTEKKRERRIEKRTGKIVIEEDKIAKSIDHIYAKINEIMKNLKDEDIKFTDLVENNKRESIINTFIPVIYLDHAKKIDVQQKEVFDEIYIRKRNK